MNTPFEKIYHRIQYATQIKGRQILQELETDPTAFIRFCRQAERLPAGKALVLCPLLSAMQSPEYMNLLYLYATQPDPELRSAALDALRNAAASVRSTTVYRLLAAPDAELRQAACNILGTENTTTAADRLIHLLHDSSTGVVIAALEALRNIPLTNAARACVPFLKHADENVRRLAIQVLVSSDLPAPVEEWLRLLEHDSSLEIRRQVLVAFSQKTTNEAIPVLCRLLLAGGQPVEIRKEAAVTLAQYPGGMTAKALFQTYAHNMTESALAQVCRNSLLRMPEDILLDLCQDAINSMEPSERLEAATLAGMFAHDRARAMLWERLLKEQDPLIVASLLEEAGKCGATGVWDIALSKLDGEPVVAYLAAQTLARLLLPPHLMEFASILRNRSYGHFIHEVILERLASYGRVRGLPQEVVDLVAPFLSAGYANVAVLAAEVVCCHTGAETIRLLLNSYHDALRPEVQSSICRGILIAGGNSLKAILEIAGEDELLKVSAILSRMQEVNQGECEAGFFIRMASLAQQKKMYAHLCLTLAACLKPAGLSDAITSCGGSELLSLLPVWQVLPVDLQLNAPVPWLELLKNPDPQIRRMVLNVIPCDYPPDVIGAVADLAFADPDADVAALAAKCLRSLFAEAKAPMSAAEASHAL